MAKHEMTIEKHKAVIDEYYSNGMNAADAYMSIYRNVKKRTTAQANFNHIKNDPTIKAYILQKQEEAAKIVNLNIQGVLKELKQWLEADITETIGLAPEEVKDLPIEIRRMITKYKRTKKEYYDGLGNPVIEDFIELHFASKERAIEMIAKHIGFYEKDNEQKANDITIFASSDKHMKIVNDIIKGK